jgi:phage FluMu gp28-like protein
MYYLGLDLGQRRDHSAIAVVEKVLRYQACAASGVAVLHLRYVERVPLGTTYPEVVARVRELVTDSRICGQSCLAVDATGLGAPVVQMLRSARLGCDIAAVTMTGGDKASQRGNDFNVPKRDLVAGVQVLLEQNNLRIARTLEGARSLIEELVDVRATVSVKGRVRLGADGCGEHDDLVIALALACWRAKRKEIDTRGMALPGMPWK